MPLFAFYGLVDHMTLAEMLRPRLSRSRRKARGCSRETKAHQSNSNVAADYEEALRAYNKWEQEKQFTCNSCNYKTDDVANPVIHSDARQRWAARVILFV